MKKHVFLFAMFCFGGNLIYGQTWLWAKSAHGAFDDWGSSITMDASGNTYVAGRFTSTTLSFGTTDLINSDTTNTGNTGMSIDIFLAKYDVNGTFLWAKSARGADNMDERVFSVAADGSGNVYMAGMFSSPTLSFGSHTLTNAGIENIFLVKYDAGGNVLWAKSTGGSYHDWGYSVAVGPSGNIYLTGVFQSPTITFDTITLTNLDNTGNYTDLFLAKYNSDGAVLWAKKTGGINYDWALSVGVDANEKVLVSGYFYSPELPFGSTTLTNLTPLYGDMFLAQYDENGNVMWARMAGGSDDDNANSVAVDAAGNIYVTGSFISPSLVFDTTTLTSRGSYNVFLAKYNTDGNVLWAKCSSGTDTDIGYSVAVDASGNAFITGCFYSPTLVFDTINLTNAGSGGIFLAKYSSDGNLLWAKSEGGTENDGALSVAADASGNAHVTGWYRDVCSFGTSTLTNVDPVFGGSDLFIAKLGGTTEINESDHFLNFLIFPNPASDVITVNINGANSDDLKINIYDHLGRLVRSELLIQPNRQINISGLSDGVFTVAIISHGLFLNESLIMLR